MAILIGAAKFKATCLEVLDRVHRTGEEVIVTKRGKSVARVVAETNADSFPQNELHGTAVVTGDIIGPSRPRSAWDALNAAKRRNPSRRKN